MSQQYPQDYPPAAPQPAPKKKHTVRNVVLTVLAVIVVGSIIGAVNGTKTTDPNTSVVAGPSSPKPNDSGKTSADKPEVTKGQEQALRKAESYLDLSAFSKKGLADQLEYEGFSKADAEWAVDHVDVDWNEQAVKKALSYLEHSAFSESELADQLEYEGFTAKQAKHGASEAYKR